ncbi:hypothetical protein MMC16_001467 [Acarospora aff. strigata]|nr:hypothetical protein [Acarospora aff. strigata]
MSTEIDKSPDLSVKAGKRAKRQLEEGSKKKRKRDDPTESQHSASKKSRREPTRNGDVSRKASVPSDPVASSPFHVQTSSLYLPLSPITQLYPLKGLCAEHLSPLILTYYALFHGVVLSYCNARLSEQPATSDSTAGITLARSVNEYAVSFIWVTADFLVFRPKQGGWIEGWVNLQNEGHLGLVCWNLFNVSIERKRLPKAWTWVTAGMEPARHEKKRRRKEAVEEPQSKEISVNGVTEGQGYFKDAEGNKIEGRVWFRVRDLESSLSSDKEKGFLSIEGSMLGDEEETEVLAQETARVRGRDNNKARSSDQHGKLMMTGAVAAENGDKSDSNEVIEIARPRKSKHRVGY